MDTPMSAPTTAEDAAAKAPGAPAGGEDAVGAGDGVGDAVDVGDGVREGEGDGEGDGDTVGDREGATGSGTLLEESWGATSTTSKRVPLLSIELSLVNSNRSARELVTSESGTSPPLYSASSTPPAASS